MRLIGISLERWLNMRRRNKIIVGVIIFVVVSLSIGAGVSYYLMSHYSFLGAVFNNNPLAVLEAASKIAINQVTSSPTKSFNMSDVNKDYHKTVEFPENILELETAEQIIEWSVVHQNQPWIGNITAFLETSQVPVGDIALHIAFINTQSNEIPVMTVTYLSWNNTQIVEKGWTDSVPYNSYTVVVTEEFAILLLENLGDSDPVVKAIIQNYNGAVTLINDETHSTYLW